LQDEISQLREEIDLDHQEIASLHAKLASLEKDRDVLSDNQLIQLRLIHELKDKSNGPTDTEKERCQRRDKTVQLWRNKTVQFYLRLLPSHISTHLILKSSEELSPASCDP
jgi:predicted  nucleic acid-binding Zn-ribbon protein